MTKKLTTRQIHRAVNLWNTTDLTYQEVGRVFGVGGQAILQHVYTFKKGKCNPCETRILELIACAERPLTAPDIQGRIDYTLGYIKASLISLQAKRLISKSQHALPQYSPQKVKGVPAPSEFGLKPSLVFSDSRQHECVREREQYVLALKGKGYSASEIARHLDKHHTTILHIIKKASQ